MRSRLALNDFSGDIIHVQLISPAPCCNPCCPTTLVSLSDLIDVAVADACACTPVVKDTTADLRTILSYQSDWLFVTLGGAAIGDGFGKDWYYAPASMDVDTGLFDTTVVKPDNIPVGSPGRLLQRL